MSMSLKPTPACAAVRLPCSRSPRCHTKVSCFSPLTPRCCITPMPCSNGYHPIRPAAQPHTTQARRCTCRLTAAAASGLAASPHRSIAATMPADMPPLPSPACLLPPCLCRRHPAPQPPPLAALLAHPAATAALSAAAAGLIIASAAPACCQHATLRRPLRQIPLASRAAAMPARLCATLRHNHGACAPLPLCRHCGRLLVCCAAAPLT